MKKLFILLVIVSVFFLGALLISSCQTVTSTPEASVSISVSTDKTIYSTGETVTFYLIVTNEGMSSVEVTNGRFYASRYTIKNSDGITVITLPEISPTAFQDHLLPAGSTESSEISWEQNLPLSTEVASRGNYSVIGDSVYTTKTASVEFVLN